MKSNLNPGYIWLPYILSTTTSIIGGTANSIYGGPGKPINSRYYKTILFGKNEKRISKIKKILLIKS